MVFVVLKDSPVLWVRTEVLESGFISFWYVLALLFGTYNPTGSKFPHLWHTDNNSSGHTVSPQYVLTVVTRKQRRASGAGGDHANLGQRPRFRKQTLGPNRCHLQDSQMYQITQGQVHAQGELWALTVTHIWLRTMIKATCKQQPQPRVTRCRGLMRPPRREWTWQDSASTGWRWGQGGLEQESPE